MTDKRNEFDCIHVYNPSTHELMGTVPSATAEDVVQVLSLAQKGKEIWGEMNPDERCDILIKVADKILEHKEELAKIVCCEQGEIFRFSMDEVEKAASLFRGYAEKARYMYGAVLPDNDADMIMVRHEPLGVIACIIPFNFPVELIAQKVAPALATGNAVVVKPASDTPLSAVYLMDLLHQAGVPEEAAQLITGSGSIVGDLIASSPLINGISLTGSTEVGIHIANCASKNLTQTFLELGGNDALVIFEDVDIEAAVNEAVAARITNSGQVCCSTKRCIVHNSIKEEFVALAVEKMKNMKVGNAMDPTSDLGPLINESAAITAEKQIADMVSLGARCVTGGHHFNKTYFEPSVLTDVTPDMPVAKDLEIFAPLVTVIGFETEKEAIDIVNQSKYGLSGGVMSADMARGIRVASKIDSGGVVVGGSGMYRTNHMPFGGHKMSGYGTEGFLNTLEEMTKTKSIVLKNVLR